MKVQTTKDIVFAAINGESILNSALLRGLVFEHSCKKGLCGICKTELIKGEVIEQKPQLALTEEDRKGCKILTCCCEPKTDILIDIEDLTVLKDVEIKILPARISTINFLSTHIAEIRLRFPSTVNFYFLEGQYIDLIYGNIRRSYSIASISDDNGVTLLIKKVAQGLMSDYIFNQAKVNDLVRIEGPKGTFFLRQIERPLVFLATGTGIAPIMSILKKLDKESRLVKQHNIYLFWGNGYADEFIWRIEFNNINVIVEKIISKQDENWIGKTGYVQDVAIQALGLKIKNCDVYACGSKEMIQSAKQKFINMGLPERQFYSDVFVQSY